MPLPAGLVTGHTDYEAGKRYEDGEGETPTGLPASNVMEFRLGKEGSLVARPSGTEPKLKFYYSCGRPTGPPLKRPTARSRPRWRIGWGYNNDCLTAKSRPMGAALFIIFAWRRGLLFYEEKWEKGF